MKTVNTAVYLLIIMTSGFSNALESRDSQLSLAERAWPRARNFIAGMASGVGLVLAGSNGVCRWCITLYSAQHLVRNSECVLLRSLGVIDSQRMRLVVSYLSLILNLRQIKPSCPGHPFDTVKIRLQTAEVGRFKGPMDVLRQVTQTRHGRLCCSRATLRLPMIPTCCCGFTPWFLAAHTCVSA